jgi:hypothetical protein
MIQGSKGSARVGESQVWMNMTVRNGRASRWNILCGFYTRLCSLQTLHVVAIPKAGSISDCLDVSLKRAI